MTVTIVRLQLYGIDTAHASGSNCSISLIIAVTSTHLGPSLSLTIVTFLAFFLSFFLPFVCLCNGNVAILSFSLSLSLSFSSNRSNEVPPLVPSPHLPQLSQSRRLKRRLKGLHGERFLSYPLISECKYHGPMKHKHQFLRRRQLLVVMVKQRA